MSGFDSHPRLTMGAKKSFLWEDLPPEKLWYLVGLITSDGSLSVDGRHIDITSKEKDFLKSLKEHINISCSIGSKTNGQKKISYRIQIGSRSFYLFLQKLGLTSNKSLTLQKIAIPEEYFSCFLRGVIDGDGCIRKWQSPLSCKFQWYLKITSGSEKFLIWLNKIITKVFSAGGHIYLEKYKNYHAFILKISKKEAIQKILKSCYGNNDISLKRKKVQAIQFLNS